MATTRRMIPYRPDEDEEKLLEALAKKWGLSMTRVLGIALREKAERDGVHIQEQQKEKDTTSKH